MFTCICSWRPRRCWLAWRLYCGSTWFYLRHLFSTALQFGRRGARKIRDPHWRHCIFFYLYVFTQIKQKRPKYDVQHTVLIFIPFWNETRHCIACLFKYSHSSLPSNPSSIFVTISVCSAPVFIFILYFWFWNTICFRRISISDTNVKSIYYKIMTTIQWFNHKIWFIILKKICYQKVIKRLNWTVHT